MSQEQTSQKQAKKFFEGATEYPLVLEALAAMPGETYKIVVDIAKAKLANQQREALRRLGGCLNQFTEGILENFINVFVEGLSELTIETLGSPTADINSDIALMIVMAVGDFERTKEVAPAKAFLRDVTDKIALLQTRADLLKYKAQEGMKELMIMLNAIYRLDLKEEQKLLQFIQSVLRELKKREVNLLAHFMRNPQEVLYFLSDTFGHILPEECNVYLEIDISEVEKLFFEFTKEFGDNEFGTLLRETMSGKSPLYLRELLLAFEAMLLFILREREHLDPLAEKIISMVKTRIDQTEFGQKHTVELMVDFPIFRKSGGLFSAARDAEITEVIYRIDGHWIRDQIIYLYNWNVELLLQLIENEAALLETLDKASDPADRVPLKSDLIYLTGEEPREGGFSEIAARYANDE